MWDCNPSRHSCIEVLQLARGSDERRAIAVVVIGGQTLSLLLTLLVTPVVYSLLDNVAQTAWGRAFATRSSNWTRPLAHLFGRRRKLKPAKEELSITPESGD